MMKRRKGYQKIAEVIVLCILCGCNSKQEMLSEKTNVLQVQESVAESTTEYETEMETGLKQNEGKEKTTEEAAEQLQKKETMEFEEKWNAYWADGVFTFEETEFILQAAGYTKNADGFYMNANDELLDVGITYDFIQNGYTFKQEENGSYHLVSFLEAGFDSYDAEEMDRLIQSYGYDIEYNNDMPYVRDTYGEIYSYEKFASLLLYGGTIPYAPGSNAEGGSNLLENTVELDYQKVLQGEWVSAKGYEICISDRDGGTWLNCSAISANESEILELSAEIWIDADGMFYGEYMGDSWENQGSVYGEYQQESDRMNLMITVDVDSGMGRSLEMNAECVRKYHLSFGEFVSMGADAYQLGMIWCEEEEECRLDIRRNKDSAYVDLYHWNISVNDFRLYQDNYKIQEDENGIYIEISDAFCNGKVYFYACGDNENLWIFSKMVLPYDEYNLQYYQSEYSSYFNRKIYRQVERG